MRFCTLTAPDESRWDEKQNKMVRRPKYYHNEESIKNLLKYAVRFKENGEGEERKICHGIRRNEKYTDNF